MIIEQIAAARGGVAQQDVQVILRAHGTRRDVRRRGELGRLRFAERRRRRNSIVSAARTSRNRERGGGVARRRRNNTRGRGTVSIRRRRDANKIVGPRRAGWVAEIQIKLVEALAERHLVLLGRVSETARRKRTVRRCTYHGYRGACNR